MSLRIGEEYLLRTLADLIRINSINPILVPGAPGEAEIGRYVADSLRKIGLNVEIHEPAPGRISVLGILKGTGRGRSLMLNSHLDTVGVEGMGDPFSGSLRGGRMYGRGAQDMKGSLAACMAAAKALAEAEMRMKGDLLVAAVADEEYASIGTTDLLAHNRPDGAIVTEPTDMGICLAHKGFVWLEVETLGRAAHGSRYDLGIDANMHMGVFMAELRRLEQQLRRQKGHSLLGSPSLHAAVVQGGSGLSTYSASCKLQIERRTIPGETEEQVLDEIEDIISRLAGADPTFQASVRSFSVREPFQVSADTGVVKLLHQAVREVLAKEPTFTSVYFWCDAALLSAAGVETVVMGPIGGGLHSTEEWVDVQSLIDLAQVLARAALNYCD